MMDRYTIAASMAEATLGRAIDPREHACLARGLRAFYGADRPLEGLVDALVASLDADISRQIAAILHHPRFQALESGWRGLWLVVSRTGAGQNARCEVLNCSKEDLLLDFEDSPEIPKSGLYKLVYSAEYGPFGGRPFTAILADYLIGPGDLDLLDRCAAVAAMAHSPFLAGMSPALAGRPSAQAVAEEGPLPSPLAAPWQAFCERWEAGQVGLVFPRCLGRSPHPVETLRGPQDLLWQSGIYALAVCLVRSFEVCRLPCNLTGPVDGLVEDLPTWSGPRGDWAAPSPLEAWLSVARQEELAALGVIPLGAEAGSGEACFHLAPTLLSGTPWSVEDLSEPDRALHRQLSIVLLASRFAQAAKVIHREQIGAWTTREGLLEGLRAAFAAWTLQSGGGPPPGPDPARARRPLRRVEIQVDEALPESPGFRRFALRLEPNWSLGGRFFTVATIGKLDTE